MIKFVGILKTFIESLFSNNSIEKKSVSFQKNEKKKTELHYRSFLSAGKRIE